MTTAESLAAQLRDCAELDPQPIAKIRDLSLRYVVAVTREHYPTAESLELFVTEDGEYNLNCLCDHSGAEIDGLEVTEEDLHAAIAALPLGSVPDVGFDLSQTMTDAIVYLPPLNSDD